jgi:hypothetical protein
MSSMAIACSLGILFPFIIAMVTTLIIIIIITTITCECAKS